MKGTYGDHKGTFGQKERFKDQRHDPYQARKKWPDSTRCPTCGVVFVDGRWAWGAAPEGAHEVVCPACQRIADEDPAGLIELRGPFMVEHWDELLHLIRHTEAAENAEHPLERLMGIQREDDVTRVTTTGLHLARRIGTALAHAYRGDLKDQYAEEEQHVRVYWER